MRFLGRCPALVILCLCIFPKLSTARFGSVSFTNGSYHGIVIAINPSVPENFTIVEQIKNIVTEASDYLWQATNQRAAIGHVKILLPKTWTNGSWPTAGRVNYLEADVLVANRNPVYGDLPYTLQYGQCGERASYIHLTPDYVLNDGFVINGAKGKVFVHEWAHLRWGVFDEAPRFGSDQFYIDSNGSRQAIRCPLSLTGKNLITVNTPCATTPDGPSPYQEGCEFIPDPTQPTGVTASLMGHQQIENVTHFCHNNQSDPGNVHNPEAPNEQNRLCDRRSTWEVIMTSPDFLNKPTPTNVNITPTFEVIRTRLVDSYVLVLDVSGSMGSNNKLTDMIRAATILVTNILPNGSEVGIVTFSSSATTLANIQIVDGNRASLQMVLSTLLASGSTCIGCGINQAISLLESGSGTAGGRLIILTDGEETAGPYVSDTRLNVLDKKVCVSAIFFGSGVSNQNIDLQRLTDEACGQWFFNQERNLQQLVASFSASTQSNDGDIFATAFQIVNEMYELTSGLVLQNSVAIDSTIGNNTAFVFSYEINPPVIVLTSPSNETYCSNLIPGCASAGLIDNVTKTIVFSIPGTAETGIWTYTLNSTTSETTSLTVTSSAASRLVEPVVVNGGYNPVNDTTQDVFVVNAEISVGFLPVLGVKVEAIITPPSGNKTTLELFDRGSDPDVRANDGVYSRYFIPTKMNRHSLRIVVRGNASASSNTTEGSSAASSAFVYQGGVLVPNNVGVRPSRTTGISFEEIGSFSRTVSPGGIPVFRVSGPGSDLFPPSRILNLNVKRFIVYESGLGFELTFTSPGDDLDMGTASGYNIQYSVGGSACFTSDKETCMLATNQSVVSGDIYRPKTAGEDESFILKIPDSSSNSLISVWFAIQAFDEVGNQAEFSNIASKTVVRTPTTTTTTTSKTTTVTSPSSTTTTTTTVASTTSTSFSFGPYQISTFALGCALVVSILAGVTGCVLCRKRNTKTSGNVYENVRGTTRYANNTYHVTDTV